MAHNVAKLIICVSVLSVTRDVMLHIYELTVKILNISI